MKIVADVFSIIGFLLLVDWYLIPEWYLQHFIYYTKHANTYNKFDKWVVKKFHSFRPYDDKKESSKNTLAFCFLLISGILSLLSNWIL